MSLSKISYFFCISFIVGIGISSFLSVSQLTKLAFFIFPLIFLFFILYFLKKKRKIIVFSFCLIFVLTGVLVYQAKEMKISESGLNKYNDQGEVILEGVVLDEPDVREDNTKIEVDVVKVFDEKVKGKILITVGRYSDYNYGDKLIIKGTEFNVLRILKNRVILKDENGRKVSKAYSFFFENQYSIKES